MLAGAFGPGTDAIVPRLRALSAQDHREPIVRDGPLAVVGAPPSARDQPLCRLEGRITNRAELAADLRLAPDTAPDTVLAHGLDRWGSGRATRPTASWQR